MTNRDDIHSMINSAIDAYTDSPYTCDEPLFHLTIELLIAANRELTDALPSTTDADHMRYYFSDSTYDDYTNPTNIIADCNLAIAALYELTTIDELRAAFACFADDIDYITDYLDDAPELPDLAALIAYLRAMNSPST